MNIASTKKQNKFSRYFSTDLSSMQARGIFFILLDNLTEEEKKELEDAYYPIAEQINRKELSLADQGWMF